MKRDPVDSSNIASIGYNEKSKTMEVEFLSSGDVWEYDDVPLQDYEDVMAGTIGGSIGKTFNAKIRGKRTGRKVS